MAAIVAANEYVARNEQSWMLRFALLLALVASSSLVACRSAPAPATVADQSTPEAAVRSLFAAWTAGDVPAVQRLVDPADTNSSNFLRGLQALNARGVTMKTDNLNVFVVANEGDTARARTQEHFTFIDRSGKPVQDMQTGGMYSLVRRAGKWYLIALDEPVPPGWILGTSTPAP